MEPQFTFATFEQSIAHYKANPPVGGEVELEFSDEDLALIQRKTAQYDCSTDVFLCAVLACFMGEDQASAEQAEQPSPTEG